MKPAIRADMPLVPASWGELLDKISILKIKSERIVEAKAAANVKHELTILLEYARPIFAHESIAEWEAGLRRVNERIWDVEDRLRHKERDQAFDDEFVTLARAAYLTNDERSAIKRAINAAMGSAIVEEKQYL